MTENIDNERPLIWGLMEYKKMTIKLELELDNENKLEWAYINGVIDFNSRQIGILAEVDYDILTQLIPEHIEIEINKYNEYFCNGKLLTFDFNDKVENEIEELINQRVEEDREAWEVSRREFRLEY